MKPEARYQALYEEMYHLCEEQGWGDPFSYARSREIHMAGILGHRIADDYSGADAFDEDGGCLLYTSPSPRDMRRSRMPSSA